MKFIISIVLFSSFAVVYGQSKKNKVVYKEYQSGYYENVILKDINSTQNTNNNQPKKSFQVDYTGQVFPTDTSKYQKYWHTAPKSQGNTGTCWCFSATSFMESEVYRLQGKKVDLSEMYTVYWEYIDRAIDFVRTRGNTYFAQGSEANAIPRIWKKYGIVPESDYKGITGSGKFFNHEKMEQEMNTYLQSVKQTAAWSENIVMANIKSILGQYMSYPPTTIRVDGKEITPKQYLDDVLKLRMDDYFSFMSTKEFKFNETHELIEDDNWFHGDNYYNLSLNDYFDVILKAIDKGYTISICGDVSEPGYDRWSQVAMIPSFDIPSEFIDDDARQMRLTNKTTTDDHCIHLVGYQKVKGEYWFMIKDSGSGAFDGAIKGYRFYHQDYIKLKMMNIMVHKEAARSVLDKIIK